MNLQPARLHLMHEDLTKRIIGIFFDVYNELGAGFLEKVYRRAFERAALEAGLDVRPNLELPVWFRGSRIAEFFPDFCVGGRVIVEIKARDSIVPADEAQLMNYLRASDVEVGLILNFGPRAEYRRRVYENSRKRRHQSRNRETSPEEPDTAIKARCAEP